MPDSMFHKSDLLHMNFDLKPQQFSYLAMLADTMPDTDWIATPAHVFVGGPYEIIFQNYKSLLIKLHFIRLQ